MNLVNQETRNPTLERKLTLMDSILMLVGGIVGSAIFLAVSDVADQFSDPRIFLGVWVLGGAITLLACFAFAELGAMFPTAGGQYIYLREAYGEFYGFLFGWVVLFINFSGTAAALAVGFATYLNEVFPYGAERTLFDVAGFGFTLGSLVAMLTIAFLTYVNIVGLRRAVNLQNFATWLKFAAILVFVGLGLLFGKGDFSHFSTLAPVSPEVPLLFSVALALNGVFFAYDGWTYVPCTAGEVKNPQRNIPLSLIIGVITVALIYICLNFVYLYALPLSDIKAERTMANTVAMTLFFPSAGRWMSLLIAVSCFGAASASILAGARVVYAMACDGAFFPRLSYVHPRYHTPSKALLALGAWSAVLALSGKYDQLYTYVMFIGVLAYVATVAAVFVLRKTRPDIERPYRCTGYPVLPAIYIVIACVWAAIVAVERPTESLAGVVILAIGVPVYLYWHKKSA